MDYEAYWRKLAQKQGIEAAFGALLKRSVDNSRYLERCRQSRFYRWEAATEAYPPAMVPVTEEHVSNAFDLSDCHDESTNSFWLDDNGTFHKVTASMPGCNTNNPAAMDEFYKENPGTVYTWDGDLVANGQKVGTVRYSDH